MISLNLKQPEHRSNPLENPGVSLAGGVDYLLDLRICRDGARAPA